MGRLADCHFAVVLALLFTSFGFLVSTQAREQGMGLILPTKEELRSIPPASPTFSVTDSSRKTDLSLTMILSVLQSNQNSYVGWRWVLAYAMKNYHECREEGKSLFTGNGQID